MKRFVQSWVINTMAVLVAVNVVSGIHYRHQEPLALLGASLLLGILNAFLRPILMILTLPILIVTLGLFRLVINALLLYFVGRILPPHFIVESFSSAFWGALVISVISTLLNVLTGMGNAQIRFERRRRPPGSGRDGGGPVIDV